jgi:16S rRNA (uracil1498-N3)-methyltransferase
MTTRPGNRLYVPDPLAPGADLRLNEERSHYAGRVLRLRVGNEVVLFNGDGSEFVAVITEVSRSAVRVQVRTRRERDQESPLRIHLVQGVSRGERMDIVVQKATELGVHRVTPIMTAHSVLRLDVDKGRRRMAHWTKIAQGACEQCGRNVVPLVDAPQTFDSWIAGSTGGDGKRIVFHPDAGTTLAGFPHLPERVELLIGPEGGLSGAEVDQASAAGFTPCSLGPRILRTETAAIAAVAILQSHYGDLGSTP